MKPAQSRWTEPSDHPLQGPGLHPLLGQILASRGFVDVADPALPTAAPPAEHDPMLLSGMDKAVAVIRDALNDITRGSDIIGVYGDYDADGVLATAAMVRVLRETVARRFAQEAVQDFDPPMALAIGRAYAETRILHHIPNRFSDGYGLHTEALRALAGRGATCVVTVDCGTSSVREVDTRPSGMRIVVTDHHLPLRDDAGRPLLADDPHLANPAEALVNPNRGDDPYPFAGLCGTGIAYKLIRALEANGVVTPDSAESVLPFVALATIADVVPMVGENRTIVAAGLKALEHAPVGLEALLLAARQHPPYRASDLAFSVIPWINAAGRMQDADIALTLCLAEDEVTARALADQLRVLNSSRRDQLEVAVAEAIAQVQILPENTPALVLDSTAWQQGIVGLIAQRISDLYAVPTVCLSVGPDEARGSGRAPDGFDIVAALEAARDTLIRYGGHTHAAGLSLATERIADFRSAFQRAIAAQIRTPRLRRVAVDARIEARNLDRNLLAALALLEPCGHDNPPAILEINGCQIRSVKVFGKNDQNIELLLETPSGMFKAVTRNRPGWLSALASKRQRHESIDVCGTVGLRERDGLSLLQMNVLDIHRHRTLPQRTPPTPDTGAALQ